MFLDRSKILFDEPVNQVCNSALDTQVGGSHYKQMAIQPVEFINKNNLGYIEGNIIKYICRYEQKNGIKDLEKIKHYVDLLIEFKYPDSPKVPK